ncbi:MAG: metallophosphoesterase, partial [Candidatus Heimdallarchaeota archaeon]|nr:metallophosphoesterase [Candidatus Heimdallarchaeota archaeon]
MSRKVLYTSDPHGNMDQYRKLVKYAIDISADFVIVGGDLAPKSCSKEDYVKVQRRFFEKDLPEVLAPLGKHSEKPQVFLMMGNDDHMANLDVFEKYDSDLYKVIHGKRVHLADDFYICGYSCVPITPFCITKDWEKYDLSEVPECLRTEYENRKIRDYRRDGFRSIPDGSVDFSFSPDMEKTDSIQKDLSKDVFTKDPGN